MTVTSMSDGIAGMSLCSAVAVAWLKPRGGAGEQQCGEQAAADGDGVVAHGVDAAIDDPEAAGLDAMSDLAGRETERDQLPTVDNAALGGSRSGRSARLCAR